MVVATDTNSRMSSSSNILNFCLLQLPPALNASFHQDRSVHRTHVLCDALALVHVLLFNYRVLKMFEPLSASPLLPHERAYILMSLALAAMQLGVMSLQPDWYRQHRTLIARLNRVLRLLVVVLSAINSTPESARKSGLAFCKGTRVAHLCAAVADNRAVGPDPAAAAAAVSDDTSLGSNVHLSILDSSQAACDSAARKPGCLSNTGGSRVDPQIYVVLLRSALTMPVLYLSHAQFVVSFQETVLFQLATLACCLAVEVNRVCVFPDYGPDAVKAAVSVCNTLSGLAHVAGQLLDWHLPASPAKLFAASAHLCSNHLAALLAFRLWVQVVVLLLVPCTCVFCLEWFLKAKFLRCHAAAAADGGGAAAAADGGAAAVAATGAGASAGAVPDATGAGVSAAPLVGHTQQEPSGDPTAEVMRVPAQQRDASVAASTQQTTPSQDDASLGHGEAASRQHVLQQQLHPALAASLGSHPYLGPWLIAAVVVACFVNCVLAAWFVSEVTVGVVLQKMGGLVCDSNGRLRLQPWAASGATG